MLSKKLLLSATALSMTAMPVISVYAEENINDIPVLTENKREDVNEKEKGSISIQLQKSKNDVSLANVKFGITKVADLDKGEYVLLKDYKDVNVDINNIDTANNLDSAANKFNNLVKTPDKTITTDKNGKASIKDLDVGVYLISIVDEADYDNLKPALIAVPSYIEKEGYKFDMEVIPKHSPKSNPNTGVYTNDSQYIMLIGAMLASGSLGVIAGRKSKESKC